jgi:two-component system nitrogen regulation response regulator GlnG
MVEAMITILIGNDVEKVKEIVLEMLGKEGNTNIAIIKQENTVKIMKKDDLREMVSLKDKVVELEESLYNEKRGMLYKVILEVIEKPLIEYILERTEGNQLKAARILGINRNTMRAKIKKLEINVNKWKIA